MTFVPLLPPWSSGSARSSSATDFFLRDVALRLRVLDPPLFVLGNVNLGDRPVVQDDIIHHCRSVHLKTGKA